MKPDRLSAFTDGVLAIVITIMVLELKVPESGTPQAIELHLFGGYALSFVNIGIFWSNHHHLMQSAHKVDGRVLWANLLLLFPLTLIPFVIRWIGEAGITALPVAAYGFVLSLATIAILILKWTLTTVEGKELTPHTTAGSRSKEWVSLILYFLALLSAMLSPWLSIAIYFVAAALWLIPDLRIKRKDASSL